jgi:Protein of unknown function (DUF2961)
MLDRIMRRYFVKGLLGLGGTAAATGSLAAALSASPATPGASTIATGGLSQLFLPRSGRSRRSASWDRLGKNIDSVPVEPGQVATVAEISGTGCIRHIWMTVSAGEPDYLRRVVLRAYWDGEPSPSIESPLGDFFGVGHGRVSNYWSLPLSMVTGAGPQTQNRAALNCYFPMPFERGARLTVENQGEKRLRSLYYQIDYEEHAGGLSDALRLHAAWRRQNPTKAQMDFSDRSNGPRAAEVVNLDGKNNYVILEAKGRGITSAAIFRLTISTRSRILAGLGKAMTWSIAMAKPRLPLSGPAPRIIFARPGAIPGDSTPCRTMESLMQPLPRTWSVPGQMDDVSLPRRRSGHVYEIHSGHDRSRSWKCTGK